MLLTSSRSREVVVKILARPLQPEPQLRKERAWRSEVGPAERVPEVERVPLAEEVRHRQAKGQLARFVAPQYL